MAIQLSVRASRADRSTIGIGQYTNRLRRRGSEDAIALADALTQLEQAIQRVEILLNTPTLVNEETIVITDAGGAVAAELSSGGLFIQGVRVVGPRGSAIPAVTVGAADATYSSNEQNLLNELRASVIAIISALQTHGLTS